MDAIQLLQRDHRTIEELFARFERTGAGAVSQRRHIVRELVRELSIHAAIEEQFVYPALREAGAEDEVLEALEEHHVVKRTLVEIGATSPRDDRLAAKVRVLAESVREHVEEEERELFARLRRELDAEQLRALGEALREAKRAAPTRPHPAAPNTPPGNFVAGAVAAVFDRSRDALRGATEMLWILAERGARRGSDGVRDLTRSVRGSGRAAARTLERGARAEVLEVAEVARERGREVRDALDDAAERGARQLSRAEERTREAARTVRERTRRGASAARTTGARGRAVNRSRATPKRRPAQGAAAKRGAAKGKHAESHATVH